mgnify:CR=1 FL=1
MTGSGFDTVVAALARRFGIEMQIADTGGGYYVLEGSLRSGQWLWISDYDAGLVPLARRSELEAQGVRIGWRLQVYPRRASDGAPDTNTVLASVAHAKGTVADLDDLVGQVLRGVSSNTHVHVDANSSTTVEHGVQIN